MNQKQIEDINKRTFNEVRESLKNFGIELMSGGEVATLTHSIEADLSMRYEGGDQNPSHVKCIFEEIKKSRERKVELPKGEAQKVPYEVTAIGPEGFHFKAGNPFVDFTPNWDQVCQRIAGPDAACAGFQVRNCDEDNFDILLEFKRIVKVNGVLHDSMAFEWDDFIIALLSKGAYVGDTND